MLKNEGADTLCKHLTLNVWSNLYFFLFKYYVTRINCNTMQITNIFITLFENYWCFNKTKLRQRQIDLDFNRVFGRLSCM